MEIAIDKGDKFEMLMMWEVVLNFFVNNHYIRLCNSHLHNLQLKMEYSKALGKQTWLKLLFSTGTILL